jgi:uncharacterized protein GlcG (DUF336 family)
VQISVFRQILSLGQPVLILRQEVARARHMKEKITVSVCDAEGHLVAFQRMDGAFSESIPLAIGRAIAAAASRKSSRDKDAVLGNVQRVWRVAGAGLPIALGREVLRSLAT